MPLVSAGSLFFSFLLLILSSLHFHALAQAADSVETRAGLKRLEENKSAKRILFIDSYHQSYSWSAGIVAGVRSILEPMAVEMKIFSMDSKRKSDADSIKQAALRAKAEIESWQPDLLIASDDNASKYLIEPYYKNADLPVVFCGVNWDASLYGYPYQNATGMEEISLIAPLPKELLRFAKGNRLGILSGNVLSDRQNVSNYIRKAGVVFDKRIFVSNVEQWQEAFLRLQNEVDMLILENSMSISGWEKETMHQFIMQHTKIPSGTTQARMIPYVLLGFLQVPEEQGQYAAKTALRILAGESPDAIPIVNNQRVNASVNLDMAEKLGVIFEIGFLRNAQTYRWKN
ncbi:MAG: ABC transporter substrate binding protein [Gammaproteobacteria bacterium]|nr:ABC transporter substrate binding protein [Gammaproteobacteria bacterium]